MTPLCGAEARYRTDGTDWLYRCDLSAGHNGPHNDYDGLYQWSSPSATTPVVLADRSAGSKGQEPA